MQHPRVNTPTQSDNYTMALIIGHLVRVKIQFIWTSCSLFSLSEWIFGFQCKNETTICLITFSMTSLMRSSLFVFLIYLTSFKRVFPWINIFLRLHVMTINNYVFFYFQFLFQNKWTLHAVDKLKISTTTKHSSRHCLLKNAKTNNCTFGWQLRK